MLTGICRYSDDLVQILSIKTLNLCAGFTVLNAISFVPICNDTLSNFAASIYSLILASICSIFQPGYLSWFLYATVIIQIGIFRVY